MLEFSDCTYTADATGGYPPYSYEWYIDEEPVEPDEEGDGEVLTVEGVEDDFTLEVTIEDSRGFDESDEVFVDVSPNHPDCDLSP